LVYYTFLEIGTMATANNGVDQEFSIRCKAFSGEGVRLNRVLVEGGANGSISVWDSVAGHYTTCHSLSERAQKRIRKESLHRWKVQYFHGLKLA
jgi:hypothetical protein